MGRPSAPSCTCCELTPQQTQAGTRARGGAPPTRHTAPRGAMSTLLVALPLAVLPALSVGMCSTCPGQPCVPAKMSVVHGRASVEHMCGHALALGTRRHVVRARFAACAYLCAIELHLTSAAAQPGAQDEAAVSAARLRSQLDDLHCGCGQAHGNYTQSRSSAIQPNATQSSAGTSGAGSCSCSSSTEFSSVPGARARALLLDPKRARLMRRHDRRHPTHRNATARTAGGGICLLRRREVVVEDASLGPLHLVSPAAKSDGVNPFCPLNLRM